MILTDREIMAAVKCGQVEISPCPPSDHLSSTSIDLTLSDSFSEWKQTPGVAPKPGEEDYKFTNLIHLLDKKKQLEHVLKPRGFVLAWTTEKVKLPLNSRLSARVEGKSSIARLGVGVHVTAPTIHCGFEAPIQLEMFNFGPFEIVLKAGMRICQLIFEQTYGTPDKGYDGMFANQSPDK